ncbi:hypothetical protein MTR67_020678 [Solanum verrucosum]|uniref:Serine carboxypeptidase-like 17 n=1 Tax=Solanum verrucosum TaxID=315347 RepID=A0AAF0TW36_SOLVR|nr:hypothetical protein MTR67_020678 [Solanum verrucosum]
MVDKIKEARLRWFRHVKRRGTNALMRSCEGLEIVDMMRGPITFEAVEYNGSLPTMILNPYSWTKVASIIFIDLPVGTGFSYATTPTALQSSDLQATDHAYQFLCKWFVDHPEFLKNPFYVGGDSYSGRIVPFLTQIIAIKNEMEVEPFINLKGYLLGNPSTFEGEANYKIPFTHGMALISDELYESLKTHCKGEYLNINPNNTLCLQDVQTFKELLKGINVPYILEPKCVFASPRPHLLFGQRRSLDEKCHQLKCRTDWYKLSYHWADDDQVRDALNIRKGTIGKWERCARNLQYEEMIFNSIPYHENLSNKGYRSLIYSGDHDMNVTFLSTQSWIRSLNYSIVDDWRAWTVDNQVAGYTRSYSNQMTFATVKARKPSINLFFHLIKKNCQIVKIGLLILLFNREQGILHQSISLVNVWPCSQGGCLTSLCNQQMYYNCLIV